MNEKEQIEEALNNWFKAKMELEVKTTNELQARFKVGRALVEAKESIKLKNHNPKEANNNFEQMLRINFQMDLRTASNFIKVYHKYQHLYEEE